MRIQKLRATAGILAGAMLGITSIGTWYLVTPRLTVEAMANAAAAGDHAKLSAYMDMVALRADIRRRAAIALSDKYPPGRVVLDPARVTEALAGKVIDQVFSPKGTKRMLARRDRRMVAADVRYVILRDGPNHFIARLDNPRRVDLLFSRHGAGWLLSGIAARPATRPGRYI